MRLCIVGDFSQGTKKARGLSARGLCGPLSDSDRVCRPDGNFGSCCRPYPASGPKNVRRLCCQLRRLFGDYLRSCPDSCCGVVAYRDCRCLPSCTPSSAATPKRSLKRTVPDLRINLGGLDALALLKTLVQVPGTVRGPWISHTARNTNTFAPRRVLFSRSIVRNSRSLMGVAAPRRK